MIIQDELKRLLNYNPANGWFTNRFTRGPAIAEARAGSPTGHGYRRITLDGRRLYEHHLAWLYVHGVWPDELDHRDGNRSNNAIGNLRECTRSNNARNSQRLTGESGLLGAYLDKRNLQWYSKIQLGGQVKFLGNYSSAIEAHEAYIVAAELHHGEFALHNRPQPLIRRV